MELRDLALTVRELPDRSYRWVIMEGTGEKSVFVHYALLASAARNYASYTDALVSGIAALRTLGGRDGPRGVGAVLR